MAEQKQKEDLLAGIISAAASLLSVGIMTASEQTTLCGKKCRSECKSQYGFFEFGKKSKCTKECKAKCFEQEDKPTETKTNPSNVGGTILIIIIVIAIIFLVWWMLKK